MIRVAIAGASGYTGIELMRLSSQHPYLNLVAVSSEKYAGQRVGDIFPFLEGKVELTFCALHESEKMGGADIIFVALPHRESMKVVPPFLYNGARVIDLSADFRFRDPLVYEQWYQKHTAPELLEDAVYGLPEFYREKIKGASLVANPGCYPTAVLLALGPAVLQKIILLDTIIVDAKSGVSGAGRGTVLASLFAEVSEGIKAYKVARHQHTPEIEQELSLLVQESVTISFTPYLVPMNRGILATIYATLAKKISAEEIVNLYKSFYQKDVFVRVCSPGTVPSTHQVRGSNYCDVGVVVDARTNRVIFISAIDNLIKGGSGQAIQNMNIMTGLDETSGLTQTPLFP